ncbi:MAG: TIGR01212 family radical SAM protein [Lachnospiraceae bacterium]|nr:TIGR01212 family radical SAM protein [Lachnospiraceae bacterium]
MNENNWLGRPYYSLDAYLKKTYGEKLYKIAIDAGFTCPNRDGTLGRGGCIFCSAGGSGDYAVQAAQHASVKDQLDAGISLFGHKKIGQRFIAYFQAYTNTYGPLSHLRALYTEALREPAVAGISVATRPDCISEDIVTMLVNIMEDFPDKFVWIELGLQTIHEKTADFIRRGYPLSVYDTCVAMLHKAHIPIVTHVILGLPGEIQEHVLSTIDHINQSGTWGIKIQLLHVLKDTDLSSIYAQGIYTPLSQDSYTNLVIDCLEHLAPDIVVHRLTGDGPKNSLLAPRWSLDKRNVLNTLHHTMKSRAAYQGRLYTERQYL